MKEKTIDDLIAERDKLNAKIRELKKHCIQCGMARLVSQPERNIHEWQLQIDTMRGWMTIITGDNKEELMLYATRLANNLMGIAAKVAHEGTFDNV